MSITDRIDALLANTPASEVEEFEVCRCLRDAKTEIELLREGQRWIPVSERLPEDGQSVIVFWGKYREVGEAVFGKDDKCFSTDRGDCFDVSHWMPLPEPPEVTP